MCGIAGYSCFDEYDNRLDITMTTLGLFMQERGRRSWGWTDGTQLVKSTGTLQSGWNSSFFGHPKAALHTRQPTVGAVTEDNSHPFEITGSAGKIVGMHNGVIYNHDELQKKYERKCEVDSMHIFEHIANGMPLDDVRGYGAIVYWKDGNIHLGRFNCGELTLVKTKTAWVFASTKYALEDSLRFSGLNDGAVYFKLKDDRLYRLEGNQLFKDMKLTFGTNIGRQVAWQDFDDYEGGYGAGGYSIHKGGGNYSGATSSAARSLPQHYQQRSLPRLPGQSGSQLGSQIHGFQAGSPVGDEAIGHLVEAAITKAKAKQKITKTVPTALKCFFCQGGLADGQKFFITTDGAELVCYACGLVNWKDVHPMTKTVLPDDVVIVGSFFDKEEANKVIDCDDCDERLEEDDIAFVTTDCAIVCVQCFLEDAEEAENGGIEGLEELNDEILAASLETIETKDGVPPEDLRQAEEAFREYLKSNVHDTYADVERKAIQQEVERDLTELTGVGSNDDLPPVLEFPTGRHVN
jgi:hypothetical protein